jgi:hypothetical protein
VCARYCARRAGYAWYNGVSAGSMDEMEGERRKGGEGMGECACACRTEEKTYKPYSVHSGACTFLLPFPLGGERLVRWTGRREAILCAWSRPCLPKRRQCRLDG